MKELDPYYVKLIFTVNKAWVILLKEKITNTFQLKMDKSHRRRNKIWVGKGSES